MTKNLLFAFFTLIAIGSGIKAEQKKENEQPKKLTRSQRKKLRREERAQTPIQHAAIKRMTLQELGPAKEKYLKNKQNNLAITCLERMITLENDQFKQQAIRLELGNLYMDQGKHSAAEGAYQSFISMYPNSSDIELVYLRLTQCAFQETLTHDRDQAKTRNCLDVTEKYLSNEKYQKHRNEIETIAKNCYKKLIDHEGYVCRFYLKKGKTKAVEQRINYTKEEYLEKYPESKQDILVLECELAQAKKDHKEYAQKSTELAQYQKNIPTSGSLQSITPKNSTQESKPKKRYVKRF